MPTCLSNQLSLLMLLAIRSEVTTRELALSLGITERAVHRILRDLAESGFISIGKRGYRNQYTVHPEKSAGHPDALVTWTLESVAGRTGGIAAFREVKVVIQATVS